MRFTEAEREEIILMCHPGICEIKREPADSSAKLVDEIIEKALFVEDELDANARRFVPHAVLESARAIVAYVEAIEGERGTTGDHVRTDLFTTTEGMVEVPHSSNGHSYTLGGLDDPNHPVRGEDESEHDFGLRRAQYHKSLRRSVVGEEKPIENHITRFLRAFTGTTSKKS